MKQDSFQYEIKKAWTVNEPRTVEGIDYAMYQTKEYGSHLNYWGQQEKMWYMKAKVEKKDDDDDEEDDDEEDDDGFFNELLAPKEDVEENIINRKRSLLKVKNLFKFSRIFANFSEFCKIYFKQ